MGSLALDLQLASCLTTGRSLNFSEPQFPNMKGGGEYPPCVFAVITKPDEIHICPITVSRMWGMFCKCHFFFSVSRVPGLELPVPLVHAPNPTSEGSPALRLVFKNSVPAFPYHYTVNFSNLEWENSLVYYPPRKKHSWRWDSSAEF